VLDAIRPRGEAISPYARLSADDVDANPVLKLAVELFETPESAATYAATSVLESLFRPKKVTPEDERIWRAAQENAQTEPERQWPSWGEDFIEELKRDYFAMDSAGRVLGLNQSPFLGVFKSWEEAHRKHKGPKQ
jgi:hypothetical protein